MVRGFIRVIALLLTYLLVLYIGIQLGKATHSPIDSIVSILGVVLLVIQVVLAFVERLPRFSVPMYFRWQRFKATWISRASAAWAVSARLESEQDTALIQQAEEELVRRYAGGGVKVYRQTSQFRLIVIPGFGTLQLSVESAEDRGSVLHARLVNLRVGYAEVEERLARDVIPSLSLLRDIAEASGESYSLDATFDSGRNPFFGFYVRWMTPEHVADFHVTLLLPYEATGDVNRIDVTQGGISIKSPSLPALQTMAQDFLSLSPSLERRLAPSSVSASSPR